MFSSEITIDSRMIQSSGIGTCIDNLLPALISALPDIKFNVLGEANNLKTRNFAEAANVNIIDCNPKIYSISEQLVLFQKIPNKTKLFWSPHYNIPLLYKGNIIVTVHDVFHLAMPHYIRGIHRRLYAKVMYGFIKRKARKVICDSEFTARELVKLVGVNSKQIRIIHNGVDSSWFELRSGNRPHPKPYFIYVENVKPHKNLVRMIQAFESLVKKVPHDLILVGRNDGFITGDKIVKEYASKLADRILFTGFVTDEQLKQYIVNADALVLPSLYEGFGLPPLEAMACGCPCVVSNAASLPEVCGDAALYCDPYDVNDIADKIYMVINDAKLRLQLIERGYERVKLFSWERTARAFLNVIDEVSQL